MEELRGVTPYIGVWIEIIKKKYVDLVKQSHLIKVRGLKFRLFQCKNRSKQVAPYIGMWIEILDEIYPQKKNYVALYIGAWIEIQYINPKN